MYPVLNALAESRPQPPLAGLQIINTVSAPTVPIGSVSKKVEMDKQR